MRETTPSSCPGALWTPEAVSGPKTVSARPPQAYSRSALGRTDRHGTHKASATVEYRLIFTVAFVIFLFASAFERLISGQGVEQAASKSIFKKAREAASISAGYAFMG